MKRDYMPPRDRMKPKFAIKPMSGEAAFNRMLDNWLLDAAMRNGQEMLIEFHTRMNHGTAL